MTLYNRWTSSEKQFIPSGESQKQLGSIKDTTHRWKHPMKTWACTDSEKVKIFAGHLQIVFQSNEAESNIKTTIEQQDEILMKCLSPKEVKKTIQEEFDSSKAPGHDLITAQKRV